MDVARHGTGKWCSWEHDRELRRAWSPNQDFRWRSIRSAGLKGHRRNEICTEHGQACSGHAGFVFGSRPPQVTPPRSAWEDTPGPVMLAASCGGFHDGVRTKRRAGIHNRVLARVVDAHRHRPTEPSPAQWEAKATQTGIPERLRNFSQSCPRWPCRFGSSAY